MLFANPECNPHGIRNATSTLEWEIFRTGWRSSADLLLSAAERSQNLKVFVVFATKRMARILPLRLASIDVFRAALVSIVLTLTLGQNAALLCSVWCHPQQSANSACEHQPAASSPGVTANEGCIRVDAGATPFVREDGPRTVSASDAHQGIAAARFQSMPPPSLSARGPERTQATPQAARPLVLPLRI